MPIAKQLLVFPAVLALVGCAGVKPRESFPAVSQDVSDRTGRRVHWHDGSPADKQAEAEVAALLAAPLDADAAVQIALLNNRRLQATYEDLGVAQADLVAAGLLKNPIFDAAYRFGDAGATGKLDLGLTFDFVDLLFIGVRKDLAASDLETAKARVTAGVLDLAGDVRAAFYACQAAEQAVELRRQIAKATEASADLAKRLRDAGNTTALAYATEQALHVESELARDRAEADAVAAREKLTGLMGVWGGQTAWTVAGRLPEPAAVEPTLAGLEKVAIARSLDLKIARSQAESSLQTLGIAQPLGVLSELETGISVEHEESTWFTGPAIALPMPLFSQGQPAAAKAAAQWRQAEANYYATAVEIRSAVRAAHAKLVAARKQVDVTRTTLLPLRQQVLQQTQQQYNAMQIGAFQLLNAKRDQIESGAAYLQLLREYWTAKAELELILSGRLPRTTDDMTMTHE